LSELIQSLTQLMMERSSLSQDEMIKRASQAMNAHGEGLGWEYGPDFEHQEVDAFAISINFDVTEKLRLDQLHSLPRQGPGWRIVSGRLPRDADQIVEFMGRAYEGGRWTFLLDQASGALVVHATDLPKGRQLDVVENLVVAEVGEVNAASFLSTLETTEQTTPHALPFRDFAKTFAERFPNCHYNQLLRTKSGGRTRRP
jgi:hypothetical protein